MHYKFFPKFLFFMAMIHCAIGLQGQETSTGMPKSFPTKHSIHTNEGKLDFTAVAEETFLTNDSNQVVASMWSVSYLKNNPSNQQPVTFIFNGGPGSASVWLMMGLLGPRIAVVDSNAIEDDGAAPYLIKDNPYFLVNQTDLVFIDPIGTGYSTVINKGKNEDFWGLNEDAASIAKFIRKWVTDHQRWQCPKYIVGESFGTTRAAAVSNILEQGGQNMALNGMVLISQALDYEGSTSVDDNITSYVTYLPSMAASAWYHKKAGVGQTLKNFLDEVRSFTLSEYLPSLYLGNRMTNPQKNHIADRLSYFTGLDKDYVLQSGCKLMVNRFRKELLRKNHLVIGQLDGRFVAEEIDDIADAPTLGDPADYKIEGAFSALLNDYLSNYLSVKMDRPYLTGNDAIYNKWNWRPVAADQGWEPSYVNTAPNLSKTMRRNPKMKIMVANGYYDLITPFFDSEYTFARHGFKAEQIDMKYYEAGHMMYLRPKVMDEIAKDIKIFLSEK